MSNGEMLYRAILKGPMRVSPASGSGQFAGRTTIAAGTATAVVSTTVVKSDSLIFLQGQSTTVSSILGIDVRTIIDSTSFVVGTQNNANATADYVVYWSLMQTK